MSATGSERVTRTRAGPSKPASKSRRKQAKEVEEEESDDFTEKVPDGAEDEVMEVDPPPTRKPASRPAAKSGATGKGKAKADSVPAKNQPSRAEIEVIDDDDDDVGAPATARAINNATTNNGTIAPSRRVASSTAATKRIESLRRQLDNAQNNMKNLEKQLEESYRVRHTEAEELQQRQMEKYEEIIQTKDLLIKQQAEMLALKDPLSRDGKTSVIHMVTRETADAEKRSAEEQVAYWKGKADERERLLVEKERKITELKQMQSDLQFEIKVERENSQKAAVRNPPSALRGRGPNGVLGSDDPKHSALVRFYEDVTNLLITDIKVQESKYLKLDEWSLTCIYTHDKAGVTESRSLAFVLRFTYEPIEASAPVASIEDLDQAAQYTPLDLDKESSDFIEALQFLNNGFTFPRKQLPLFFTSLTTNMKSACEPPQSEPGSEAEQEEE